MKKWQRFVLKAISWTAVAAIVLFLIALLLTQLFIHHPYDAPTRRVTETPEDFGMPSEDVEVTTEDDMRLVGWYAPSRNGAMIIVQHGWQGSRSEVVAEAAALYRHGYGVLVPTLRAHDESDGVRITFGKEEGRDIEAWYQYLLTRDGFDHAKIGTVGCSLGGLLMIRYAAQNQNIRAVVGHSPFGSVRGVAAQRMRMFHVPPWPIAPMLIFWAERRLDFPVGDLDSADFIGQISPRPVLIMSGGNDNRLPSDSGQRLFDAAGEPKEFWGEPEAGHCGLYEAAPEEYERRVVGFFDRYLLAD